MNGRHFRQMLEAQWSRSNFVCVGLDSELSKIPIAAQVSDSNPSAFMGLCVASTILGFNEEIVEATADLVCAYKPNTAFYEQYGVEGIEALRDTIAHIHAIAPDVPVILDAKRADIGNTNAGYVRFAFDYLRADAITVHPYLGAEALQPFLDRKDKGIFVLCRTSNQGAAELQNLEVIDNEDRSLKEIFTAGSSYGIPTRRLYEYVAKQVATNWNKNGNCALVVGATYPDELREVRGLVGDMPILIPGIGAQGGDVGKTVRAGMDSRGVGMIINSSRGIIFASEGEDFAEAACRETKKLRDLINQYR